jgi:ABC-type multidrug transport system fused ATPase/permease subunit
LRRISGKVQLSIIYSVYTSAYAWFLQADPIYHTKRSTGKILSNIERAARAYEALFDAFAFELIGIFVGAVTVTVSALFYNKMVGLLVLIFLLVLGSLIITLFLTIMGPKEKEFLKADDKLRAFSVEKLSQASIIRASFATNEMNDRLIQASKNSMLKEGIFWFTHIQIYLWMRILYIFSISLLALFLFYEIQAGRLSSAVSMGIVLTYIQGTREILRLDKPMREIVKSITRIKNLFVSMDAFGKKSFPVLKEERATVPAVSYAQAKSITVEAKNIFFQYHPQTKVFDNHTFILKTAWDLPLKLYGIIGPSGIGKSTFISLLGGQLRPTSGSVKIAGVDIYEIDDNARKSLIALQGQMSSSFYGTVAYNLLFGLPEKEVNYTDEYLISLLKKVGIWSFFELKEGLATFIGEGGLSLSGGQRQRLTFANLYLRCQYFNPVVILIDEPTSSLDNISEEAITQMIVELSRKAITIVIAHQLKTVSQTVGILDFSLVPSKQEMRVYTQKELLEQSDYYKKLINGSL